MSLLEHLSILHSFSWLDNKYYTVWRNHIYFAHYQLMGIWAVSNLQVLWIMPLGTFSISFCVDICFQFSWVNTYKWNRWVVSTSNLLRSYHAGFHSGYTIFHSRQQCMRTSQICHLHFFGSHVFFFFFLSLKTQVK